ncbi:MAG: hypothetical protein JW787_03005 [Sedimentisphaerales bacterium]|nr:hypothetical protein [Sedimentisphaerales bacterium]
MTNRKKPFFSIRIEGPNIGPGRMRLADFLELANEITNAVERVGIVLSNTGLSSRRGARPKDLKKALSLDLVGFTQGSPAVLAYFERSDTQMLIEDVDFGNQIYTKWLEGLEEISRGKEVLPQGYDVGVLLKMRDLGNLFGRGITQMDFSLNHRPKTITFKYTEKAVNQIRKHIAKPESMTYTIDGRLVMVDFKETGPIFRIHPAIGEPVMCKFAESFREEVYKNILKYVRIRGSAEKDMQGKITEINIADIETLVSDSEGQLELTEKSLPSGIEFWQHHTVDELAIAQGIKAISNVDDLLGGWPGDVNDGFEEWISEMREAELIGGDK